MKKQKRTIGESLKAQFSTKSLVLIPIAVGINLIGGTLAGTLKLPLFLDMIGTILSAALAGPWVAALVGLLTNLFLALVSNPIYVPYSIVSIVAGLITGYMVKGGMFKKIWGVIVTWLVVTLSSVITASIITIFVFGGATGATGSSVLTASLIAATQDIIKSVFASAMIENLIDRAIAFAVAYILLKRIPKRFLSQYAVDASFEEDGEDDED